MHNLTYSRSTCSRSSHESRSAARVGKRSGFTLVELLIVITLFGLVMGGLMSVILTQQRFYRGASEIVDTRSQVRQASHVLPSDLRAASVSGGDIALMDADAIEFRSNFGSSMVCVVGANSVTVPPLRLVSGNTLTAWLYQPEVGDSLFIFDEGPNPLAATDDEWRAYYISGIATLAGGCPATTNLVGAETDVSWTFTLDQALSPTIRVGSPIRFVRLTRYELYQGSDNFWYLGFRDCLRSRASPCGTLQPVAGPYSAATESGQGGGIEFVYYDRNGVTTADPVQVARIELAVRGESRQPVRIAGFPDGPYRDSLAIIVALRNRR